MVDKNCYFHSLLMGEKDTLDVFDLILRSGEIKSIEKGGVVVNPFRMNKSDEICLSRKGKVNLLYSSAYNLYARQKLSFILKGNLPGVYVPEMVSEEELYWNSRGYEDSGYTDLCDEYRVKGSISIDNVVGINFPVKEILSSVFGYKYFFLNISDNFRKLRNDSSKERLLNTITFYNELKKRMEDTGTYLPIYDIESNMEIKSSDDIIKIKRKKK